MDVWTLCMDGCNCGDDWFRRDGFVVTTSVIVLRDAILICKESDTVLTLKIQYLCQISPCLSMHCSQSTHWQNYVTTIC